MPCLSAALYCKTASLRDIRMAPSSFIDQRKIPLLLFRREAVISFIFVLLQQKSDGNKKTPGCKILGNGIRRRPTLPGRVQPSTIGAEGLNFCVRNGNRWDPFAIATGNRFSFRARLSNACPTRYTLSLNLHCVLSGSILPFTRSRLRIFTTAHLTLSSPLSPFPGLSLKEAFDRLVAATSTRYRAPSAALSTC